MGARQATEFKIQLISAERYQTGEDADCLGQLVSPCRPAPLPPDVGSSSTKRIENDEQDQCGKRWKRFKCSSMQYLQLNFCITRFHK